MGSSVVRENNSLLAPAGKLVFIGEKRCEVIALEQAEDCLWTTTDLVTNVIISQLVADDFLKRCRVAGRPH
jgi:hypothetical protein